MRPDNPLRAAVILTLAIAGCFAVFGIWPGIDLAVTGLFYDPARGFAWEGNPVLEAGRHLVWWLSIGMALSALVAAPLALWRGRAVLGAGAKVWGFILLVYVLGPGVLVHGVLKAHWGRARPADVTVFGGTARFTPPHEMTDQCSRNCSFVAGEMSGAVALSLCLLVLVAAQGPRLSPWLRRGAVAVAVACPLFAGAQRIMAGRHFLSDVLLAAGFVALVALMLSFLLPKREKSG